MAVSKRTRFEVFRRDEFRCQYCGLTATETGEGITIDHVVPVALGGSDKPDNLVTACRDCNAGKSSIQPDSPLVEAVGAKAAAYALGMTDKMTRLRASIEQADEYCAEFEEVWNSFTISNTGETVPLPPDYESSLHRWCSMGVPIRLLELAAKKAMALQFPKGEYGRFTYMAGIVWNRINDDDIDYSLTEETAAVYTESEASERAVEGYEAGMAEVDRIVDNWRRALVYYRDVAPFERDFVMHHIDGTTSQWIQDLDAA